MDAHSLRVLEYGEVLRLLAAEAASPLGAQRAVALRPSSDADLVAQRLAETQEGRDLLAQGPAPSLARVADIREALARAGIPGARLLPLELVGVADTLEAAVNLRRHLSRAGIPLPQVGRIAAGLVPPQGVLAEIRRCLGPDGAIGDQATPALARMRAETRRTREEIRETLQHLVHSSRLAPILAEPVVTLRNDRYVIPVMPNYRSVLEGIIQDQSASGQTLFVEPLAVVDLNNAIRRLEREAEIEIQRILEGLTTAIRLAGGEIGSTVEALADLDLVLAKARLADRWQAAAPRLVRGGALCLTAVRHPLLVEARRARAADGEVVPIDVRVGPEAQVVVITGPNTGGKTVALKTAGLCALLTQAGLPVPASPDSETPVYESVYADIGDEQSIAQDLSTFSAHVLRLRQILTQAGPRSLVLLDEIGAATNPDEGSALANAVLEALADRGCHVLATTHLDAVKVFVAQDARMVNAAVEFDLDSLRPLYTLHIGLPGRSFAIDIASRLGIPPTIIQRSRELLGETGAEVTALLSRLQAQEQQRAADALEAAREREAASTSRRAAEQLAAELREQSTTIRRRANSLVAEIAAEARRRAEAAVAELGRGKSIRDAREAIRQLNELPEAQLTDLPVAGPEEAEAAGLSHVVSGQRVRIRHLRQTGTVLSEPTAQGQVEVQLPLGKVRVPLADLAEVAGAAPSAGGGVTWTAGAGDSLAVELNVIGLTVEEAWSRVERYLEDAMLGGLDRVRIIHGKGTGRLRKGLAELLKQHPLVAGFQMATFDEGGAGATIVELGPREGRPAPPTGLASPETPELEAG
jgi:DNA mismatch repair protein MutS2